MKHSMWVKQLLVTTLLSMAAHGQRYDSAPRRDTGIKAPASSPMSPVKVALGRQLFFDTRLSLDEKLSCSTCHDPMHGYSEARAVSVGVLGRRGKRHTPTLLGRSFGKSQFWDGRTATLEEQVLQPILAPDEMGMTVEKVLQRLNEDAAYHALTRESLADALASYLRTINSNNSGFDRFLSGLPAGFSALELEGLRLFRDKARCYICHSGPQFTDEGFHNTGVAWREGALQDEGRAAITGKPYHKGAFKTPTLRDAGRRGPYMHDGSLATLEDVINFYDRGGNANPYLDENIVPLHLSAVEKKALAAFLRNGLAGSMRDGVSGKPGQSQSTGKRSRKQNTGYK